MKKVFVLLTICMLPMMAMAQWGNILVPEVDEKIRTADAFMDALGSNKTLVIAKNATLTFQNGIVLDGVHDLLIKGEDNAKIQIKSRDEVVLSLKNCHNIRLENLSLGHEEGINVNGDSDCENGAHVIVIKYSRLIDIVSCDLWGCGWNGLDVDMSHNINCKRTVIRDCSGLFVKLHTCASVTFSQCDFIRCGMLHYGYNSFIWGCENLVFEDCRFAENSSKHPLFECGSSSGILRNCEIHHMGESFKTDSYGLYSPLTEENCRVYQDYKALSPRK